MVSGDVPENAGEGARFDGVVRGNYFVVFAVALRGHTDVGALLARYLITQNAQRFYQLRSANVARQLH